MVYQIKKFLSNKISILNEDFHIQKSRNGFYYKKWQRLEIRNTLHLTDYLGNGFLDITNNLIKKLLRYLFLLYLLFYKWCYY